MQGLAPQLLLEAAMAADGGFGATGGGAGELIYWHLTGGFEPGEADRCSKATPPRCAAIAAAADGLCGLIDAFDEPDRAYLSRPHPGLAPRFSDYAQLARVAEWSGGGGRRATLMRVRPRSRANREQLAASDPGVSAFVAASAGSGKTKLLTDRLLRLMLAGAAPERIQCLTFTKAAAAEMALRLQTTLGRWVTMPPADLGDDLRRSGRGADRRRPVTPRGRCSPRCWTCPAACGSARSTRSASRCCAGSRWRRRSRRISSWWTSATPTTR